MSDLAPPSAIAPDPRRSARRRGLLALAGAVSLAGAAVFGYWQRVLQHVESTDNAYVQGHVVQVTPQVAGTVVAVQAEDTDLVRAGQLLVKLDTADARLALAQAEAQLAQAARETRGLFAADAPLQAQVALRESEVVSAQAELLRAEEDLRRRTPLMASGMIGREEFEHAQARLALGRAAVESARAGVRAAQAQRDAQRVQTEGLAPEQHPAVQRAAARVREAWLVLKRCEIVAPVAGMVARRNVQLGQRVQAGAPLMSVVALDSLWVDANFKESQLRRLRLNQPVRLHADLYGKQVIYQGRVAGLGAGTGAAFALLPAQNATGNWIKIVQRVPVRIALDPAELQAHPLRVGLSMQVEVDVRRDDGPRVAEAARSAPPLPATGFEALEREADERVRQIVARHGGRALPAR